MQTRPKSAAREETALFSQRLSERIHSYFGKNVRKIQNAAVIPATETVIFLDLCEA